MLCSSVTTRNACSPPVASSNLLPLEPPNPHPIVEVWPASYSSNSIRRTKLPAFGFQGDHQTSLARPPAVRGQGTAICCEAYGLKISARWPPAQAGRPRLPRKRAVASLLLLFAWCQVASGSGVRWKRFQQQLFQLFGLMSAKQCRTCPHRLWSVRCLLLRDQHSSGCRLSHK